eukprot:12629246-Prorocentrum_lima.AAC.1
MCIRDRAGTGGLPVAGTGGPPVAGCRATGRTPPVSAAGSTAWLCPCVSLEGLPVVGTGGPPVVDSA